MPEQAEAKAAQATVSTTYIDRPELKETFADSVDNVFFEGQTLRINLGVTRFEQPQQPPQLKVQRFPACRLVLTPAAAIELANQLQRTIGGMVQAGVIKTSSNGTGDKKP
jgi:hypothetical protein